LPSEAAGHPHARPIVAVVSRGSSSGPAAHALRLLLPLIHPRRCRKYISFLFFSLFPFVSLQRKEGCMATLGL
jgi:hypothetical protein